MKCFTISTREFIFPSYLLLILVGSSQISVCKSEMTVVRDLSVLLDSELSLNKQVNKVASVCYFHLFFFSIP